MKTRSIVNKGWRRRVFLQTIGGLFLLPVRALGAMGRWLRWNRYEARAVDRGRQLGIGSARLVGPRRVTAYSYQTWSVCYTAGRAGIAPGGGIRIALRHLQRSSAVVQANDPAADNYVTARASGGVPVRVDVPNGWKVFMTQYFPWQNIAQVTLPEQGLAPGQTLCVTFGDRSGGSRGMRTQPFDETDYCFKCFVDARGQGEYLPLANSPTIQVVADAPHRLQVIMPSQATAGQATWCLVRVEDRYGNPAPGYRGTVRLVSRAGMAELPESASFAESDQGVRRIDGIRFRTPGIHTIEVTDGAHRGVSNPIRVTRTPPKMRLLWGDLHGHTLFSDGRGTVEQYYDYAQRVAGLDFCAVSDHAFELLDEMWAHSKAVTNRLNQPGRFVTFNAYEWSGTTDVGGDHNVYFLDDDPPLFRSALMYDPRNLQMDHGSSKVEHVEELFERLAALLTNKNVLCIPHFGGRRGNPRWHDPRVQRLIEVFSDHRRSQAWADTFLAAGHRVGIMASTDNHFGNPGYGYLKILHDWNKQEIGTSLIAVYAQQHTRESIFHALYDRRTYATTGARIIVDFRIDGRPMGTEFQTDSPPTITLSAIGTAPIDRIEINRNGRVAHVARCRTAKADLDWQDSSPPTNSTVCYYARVVQSDGEEAITSPIWIAR